MIFNVLEIYETIDACGLTIEAGAEVVEIGDTALIVGEDSIVRAYGTELAFAKFEPMRGIIGDKRLNEVLEDKDTVDTVDYARIITMFKESMDQMRPEVEIVTGLDSNVLNNDYFSKVDYLKFYLNAVALGKADIEPLILMKYPKELALNVTREFVGLDLKDNVRLAKVLTKHYSISYGEYYEEVLVDIYDKRFFIDKVIASEGCEND